MEEARKILLHPNFNQLSAEQIQTAYRLILSSGITKEQITKILKEKDNRYSYLENLPYNVFLKIIDAGEIKGKDLIALCNSSPILNGYCNRDYVIKNQKTDQLVKIIPQYVFNKLLQKAGIRVLPKEIPRRVYIREFVGGKVKKFDEDKDLLNIKGVKFILSYDNRHYSLTVNDELFEDELSIATNVKFFTPIENSLRIWFNDNKFRRYILKLRKLMVGSRMNKNTIVKFERFYENEIELTSKGEILVLGNSKCGNLGLGSRIKNIKDHTSIPDLPFIIDFDATSQTTALLDIDGHVWLFGNTHLPGFTTELPDNKGLSPCQWTPKMLPELENVVQISVGYRVYLALYANGNVRFFGDPTIDEFIREFYGLIKKKDGSLFDDIIKVKVDYQLCFMLSNKGELYVFGLDDQEFFSKGIILQLILIATDVLNFFYYGKDNLFLIY